MHRQSNEKKKRRIIAVVLIMLMIVTVAMPTSAMSGLEETKEQAETQPEESVLDAEESNNSEIQDTEENVPELEMKEETEATDDEISDNNEQFISEAEDEEQTVVESKEMQESDFSSGEDSEKQSDEAYASMSGKLSDISDSSIQISSFSGTAEISSEDHSENYGGKTISVSKGWRGDETTTSNRPQAVTFELYASNSTTPVDTLTLTKDDATMSGSSTWKGTFAGKYPLYDDNGEKITYTVKEVSVTAKDKSGKDKVLLTP